MMMSLIGVAGVLDFPIISLEQTGSVIYTAPAPPTPGQFAATGKPSRFTQVAPPPLGPSVIAPDLFTLKVELDGIGNLVGGVIGDDLFISGQINTDLDLDFEYSGTLLTGEVLGFGFADTGTTDSYDLVFRPTGGQLASFYTGRSLGVSIASENSTFALNFNAPFTGKLKGNVGAVNLSSLGNFVWDDLNGNGVQDTGEPGVEGVRATLTGAGLDGTFGTGDDTSSVTTTNAIGFYGFTDLLPGIYHVTFDQLPTGASFTGGNVGGDDALDSDADVLTGTTHDVTLGWGQQDLTLDSGIVRPASLGDFVWEDANANGLQDEGEAGIPGVTVALLSGDTVISTTTTGANGEYGFGGLSPGSYSVLFTAPGGYTFSPADQGLDDAADSDANPADGTTAVIALLSGDSNLTLDAGLYQLASVGDIVFDDVNQDGVQNDGELGIEFATVELLDAGGNVLDTQVTGVSGSYFFDGLTPGDYAIRFTPPAGYSFSFPDLGGDDFLDSDADITTGLATISLTSGEYDASIDAGMFSTINPIVASLDVEKYVRLADADTGGGSEGFTPGYWKQPQHLDDWTGYLTTQSYNAVFGVNDPFGPALTLLQALQRGGGGSNALGRHAVAALLNAAHENVDYAFTESQVIALVQQAFATGNFELVKSQLAAENEKEGDITSGGGGTPAFNPSNLGDDADSAPGPTFSSLDFLLFTFSVTNDGEVELVNLNLTDDNGTPGDTGDDFSPMPALVGGFNYGDADTDDVLDLGETWYYTAVRSAGAAGQHTNDVVAHAATVDGMEAMDSDSANWFTASDAPELGSLSGFVFLDSNNDGDIDLNDQAIVGAMVALAGTNDLNQAINLTTTTNGDGQYFFESLRPGTYNITETQPAGYLDGLDSLGSVGGTLGNDAFSDIDLLAGADGINYNFAELVNPSVGTPLSAGMTATIGYWQNKNGQALIKGLNGGSTATALSNWLATNFANLYGASAGANNLIGKTNAEIASFFKTLFKQKGVKLDAQTLAVAFATYVTDSDLAGTNAAAYGFTVNGSGTGAATYNVGLNGAAFGVLNGTTLTVLQVLQAVNAQAVDGVLYNGNTVLRNLANTVLTGINEGGDIL